MGSFSRDTFDALKHYVGVRLQQGVPIVDADWNEMEDIRRYELRAFLRWFVGDGVPVGNNGFCILQTRGENNFIIGGGDGSTDGAGRCLVEGWDVINERRLAYRAQRLFVEKDLADEWDVDPLPPLNTPAANRTDTIYLDVWEREVDSSEDLDQLVNPAIGIETCVRRKREWVVRVAEGATVPPPPAPKHVFYALAHLERPKGEPAIRKGHITDLRRTGLNLAALEDEIADARGIKGNLGNRLDESLTKGGQLRHRVVGRDQFTTDLGDRFDNLQAHLQNESNPHSVTAAQIGALAASAYDFATSTTVEVPFTDSDANNASRSISVGFKPRFVWAVAASEAELCDCFGTSSYGYADLRKGIIQQCTCAKVDRLATAPYWRQQAKTGEDLCCMEFSDESGSARRWGNLGVRISDVHASGLTIKLSRIEPGTTTATTTTTTATGTTGASDQGFQSFWVKLRLLVFG